MALNLEIEDIFETVIDTQEEAEKKREELNIDYKIEMLNPEKICNNDFNKIYDSFNKPEADEELLQSLLTHGLLENIVVTPNDSDYNTSYINSGYEYRLISGQRRLSAIKKIIRERSREEAKPFLMIPVKIEKYSSNEEELLALNSYNLHSRTLTAEDKLMIVSDIRTRLEEIIGDREPTEKQKLIKKELKKYRSIFEGMAKPTKARYMAISANSNLEIASLINEGFTIHQLAKISNFPGETYKPLHALLSEDKLEEIQEVLDTVGDLQAEVLAAIRFLKQEDNWNNEVNMRSWRNYIIEEYVTPVHLALSTTKANCSAYNIAQSVKDKENAISKIKKQIENIEHIKQAFIEGYTNLNLMGNKKATTNKPITEKFTNEFKKIEEKGDMIKVLKNLINQAKDAGALDAEVSLQIMSLL